MAKPKIEIRQTNLTEARGSGLDELIHAHHEEVMRDGIPLDVDWREYGRLERAGQYEALGAFVGPRLIGYNAFFVYRPPHNAGTLVAINDVLFLEREHRHGSTGLALIQGGEKMAHRRGARRLVYASKTYLDVGPEGQAKLCDLLQKLGYRVTETVLEKLL